MDQEDVASHGGDQWYCSLCGMILSRWFLRWTLTVTCTFLGGVAITQLVALLQVGGLQGVAAVAAQNLWRIIHLSGHIPHCDMSGRVDSGPLVCW